MDDASSSARYTRWSALIFIVIALDLVWANWGLNPTSPASILSPSETMPTPDSRLYWSEAAEETIKFERLFRFDDYRIAADNPAAVRESLLPNVNILDHQPMLNQFDPLLIAHYAETVALMESSGNRALLGAAGVIEALSLDTTGEDVNAPIREYLMGRRAYMVTNGCWHETDEGLQSALIEMDNFMAQVHLPGNGGCSTIIESAPGTIRASQYSADQITFDVSMQRDGWLVLADTDYPGWVASVDGAEQYIYRANGAFRAVQIAPGDHRVNFTYAPRWLGPAGAVSLGSALLILALFAPARSYTRRTHPITKAPTPV